MHGLKKVESTILYLHYTVMCACVLEGTDVFYMLENSVMCSTNSIFRAYGNPEHCDRSRKEGLDITKRKKIIARDRNKVFSSMCLFPDDRFILGIWFGLRFFISGFVEIEE